MKRDISKVRVAERGGNLRGKVRLGHRSVLTVVNQAKSKRSVTLV